MTGNATASLPDLQPVGDSLEELAQGEWVQLLAIVDEQLVSVVSAEHALSELNARGVELAQALEGLTRERESATHELETLGHEISGASAHWQSNVKVAGASLQAALDSLKDRLADHANQENHHIEHMRSTVADQLHVSHMDRIKVSDDTVSVCVSGARARTDALGGELVSNAKSALQQLEQRIKDDLTSRVEHEAAQRVAGEAGRLSGEVADNLVLSEASTAITGAITPILPELMALKAAVGLIKLALHPFG